MKKLFHTLTFALALTCQPLTSLAGNGFSPPANNARGLAMGGADVAIIDTSLSLATNPAGLAAIEKSAADFTIYPYDLRGVTHEDALGNDDESAIPFAGSFAAAYASRLESNPDMVLGIATYIAGGSGFSYDNLRTPFNNPRDDISALFAVFTVSGGVGWQLTDRLSIGATAGINMSSVEQEFFPQTSDAAAGFFGLDLEGGRVIKVNGSLGLQYQVNQDLRLGLVYISETPLPFKQGELKVNYSDIGEGRVEYKDAHLQGFSLPQEASIGLAWQMTPRWLLAGDIRWLGNSSTKKTILTATRPDSSSPAIPQRVVVVTPLNLKDQYVLALGTEYLLSPGHYVRAGFNMSSDIFPRENYNPLLNLDEDFEVMLGYGYRPATGLRLDITLQHIAHSETRYNNPNLPFGRSTDSVELFGLMMDIGWSW